MHFQEVVLLPPSHRGWPGRCEDGESGGRRVGEGGNEGHGEFLLDYFFFSFFFTQTNGACRSSNTIITRVTASLLRMIKNVNWIRRMRGSWERLGFQAKTNSQTLWNENMLQEYRTQRNIALIYCISILLRLFEFTLSEKSEARGHGNCKWKRFLLLLQIWDLVTFL